MKRIKQIIVAMALVVGFGVLTVPVPVGAVNVFKSCDTAATQDTAVCKAATTDDAKKTIGIIVNTLLFFVGITAVIAIIIGGIMYTTSGGDSAGVSKAKNTILYAVIGLVVAIAAYAIINFVLGMFTATSPQQQCERSGGTYDSGTQICE
ncbi:hypothetical protein H7X68_03085 [Candidatus Saccharibacteria bacterium]|nr:hypothetical protein [Candidatus Saccharibacteria bacterium]